MPTRVQAHQPGGYQKPTEPVALTCYWCGNDGTFEMVGGADYSPTPNSSEHFGFRRCPNPLCRSLAYVLLSEQTVVETYPSRRVSFDRTGIPPKVLSVFDEAVGAHANQLWMAAGMMVRKTLEEICLDQGAGGGNLQQRIVALGQMIIIPKALVAAMDQLRLLGNDAAHSEIQHFQAVSQEEIEVAIEIAKEILRATYQLQNLLQRITSLRSPSA